MDKLKAVIKEYGRWSELETYIDRIETHIEIDFIVIQVLNHHVIPEIFYRESDDRSSIQAFEDDDWGI